MRKQSSNLLELMRRNWILDMIVKEGLLLAIRSGIRWLFLD